MILSVIAEWGRLFTSVIKRHAHSVLRRKLSFATLLPRDVSTTAMVYSFPKGSRRISSEGSQEEDALADLFPWHESGSESNRDQLQQRPQISRRRRDLRVVKRNIVVWFTIIAFTTWRRSVCMSRTSSRVDSRKQGRRLPDEVSHSSFTALNREVWFIIRFRFRDRILPIIYTCHVSWCYLQLYIMYFNIYKMRLVTRVTSPGQIERVNRIKKSRIVLRLLSVNIEKLIDKNPQRPSRDSPVFVIARCAAKRRVFCTQQRLFAVYRTFLSTLCVC